jgi:hypothetical protein
VLGFKEMKLNCKVCKRAFESSKKHNRLIDSLRAKGGTLAMVDCPVCSSGVSIELAEEAQKTPPPYRCPKSGCAGWVSSVALKKRKAFDGCGACGSIWADREALFRDISTAVQRYAYRLKSYEKNGQAWLPGDFKRELKSYETKVEKEPRELAPKRKFGAYKGQAKVTDAFFDPLPEDELALWEGSATPKPKRRRART